MKRPYTTLLTILAAGFFLAHCADNANDNPGDKWYDETKAEILKQAEVKPDSITRAEDSITVKEYSYSNGNVFHERWLKGGKLRAETFYSKDGNFELRREIFENGVFLFEGIVYNDHFYGLSTWNHQNGKPEQQGIRFNDQKIGVWKKWDEAGKLTEETDYKNLQKLDSLPRIGK